MRSRTHPRTPDPPIGTDVAASGRHARPFRLRVAALRKALGSSRHEVRSGVIEGLGAVSVAVPEGAPVELDLTLSSFAGGIMVQGTVRAPWRGECRRCGGDVHGTVEARVRERFVPHPGPEDDAYPLTGDELDLEPLARDAVVLDLPLAPLCAADCLGLCPRCGTNRNLGPCGCPPPIDPRWAALDVLREPGDPDIA